MSRTRSNACIIHAYPSTELLDMVGDAGCSVVLVTPTHSAVLKHPAVRHQAYVDIRDCEAVVDCCATLDMKYGIGLVLTVNESTVVQSAYVAQALGLPGNSVKAAKASRDKYRAYQKFRFAGIDCPETIPVSGSTDEYPAIAAALGLPFIVKMADSMNSQGVIKVTSPEDFAYALRVISSLFGEPLDVQQHTNRNRVAYGQAEVSIIAQEYCAGTEYNIDLIYRDGAHSVVLVFEKDEMGGQTFGEKASFYPPLPSPGSDVTDELGKAAIDAVAALGASVGAAHVEIKHVPGRGPVVIEAGLRPGGGLTVQAASVVHGINLYEDLIAVMLGSPPKVYADALRDKAILFGGVLYPRSGRLESILGKEHFDRFSEVRNVVFLDKPGDTVRALPESAQPHSVYYVLEGNDVGRLLAVHRQLQSDVRPVIV